MWLLSRLEAHADLRLGKEIQVFAQLQSAVATGKDFIEPVDQDRLDIEQLFVGVTEPFQNGELTFRLGRQLFAFDLQRFLSSRNGPNLRQPFDAANLNGTNGAPGASLPSTVGRSSLRIGEHSTTTAMIA